MFKHFHGIMGKEYNQVVSGLDPGVARGDDDLPVPDDGADNEPFGKSRSFRATWSKYLPGRDLDLHGLGVAIHDGGDGTDRAAADVAQDHVGGDLAGAERDVNAERAEQGNKIVAGDLGDAAFGAVMLGQQAGEDVVGVVAGQGDDQVGLIDTLV